MEKSNNIFNEVKAMVIAIIGENSALDIHFNYLEVDNEYEGKQTIKSLYTNSGNVYYNYTDYPGVQCLGALTDASLRKIKEVTLFGCKTDMDAVIRLLQHKGNKDGESNKGNAHPCLLI